MSGSTVVKLGGSLLARDGGESLRRLGRVLAGAPVFIVPGGGPFADLVRHYGSALRLPQDTCHFMALSAMDQYAHLLRAYIPGSRTGEVGEEGLADFAGPRILLCASYFRRVPESELPRSWDVTSDSIAAFLARKLNASALVLMKSADIAPNLAEPEVDAFFSRLLPLPFPVWFLNGTHPERLERLLRSGHTQGLLLPRSGDAGSIAQTGP